MVGDRQCRVLTWKILVTTDLQFSDHFNEKTPDRKEFGCRPASPILINQNTVYWPDQFIERRSKMNNSQYRPSKLIEKALGFWHLSSKFGRACLGLIRSRRVALNHKSQLHWLYFFTLRRVAFQYLVYFTEASTWTWHGMNICIALKQFSTSITFHFCRCLYR